MAKRHGGAAAPRSRKKSDESAGVAPRSSSCLAQPTATRIRGRSLTAVVWLVRRRLLSNRLAAKRSYYRRQNRQTNIKQAIDQIQTELKNARSKVAIFRQLLREGGLDPEAILANANVVAVNSLPSHAQQRMQPLQQTLQQPMQQPLQPPPQQAGRHCRP